MTKLRKYDKNVFFIAILSLALSFEPGRTLVVLSYDISSPRLFTWTRYVPKDYACTCWCICTSAIYKWLLFRRNLILKEMYICLTKTYVIRNWGRDYLELTSWFYLLPAHKVLRALHLRFSAEKSRWGELLWRSCSSLFFALYQMTLLSWMRWPLLFKKESLFF